MAINRGENETIIHESSEEKTTVTCNVDVNIFGKSCLFITSAKIHVWHTVNFLSL